jgi:hypothetical protein
MQVNLSATLDFALLLAVKSQPSHYLRLKIRPSKENAQIIYLSLHGIIHPNPLQFRQLLRVPTDITPMEDFHRITGFLALFHVLRADEVIRSRFPQIDRDFRNRAERLCQNLR